MGCKKAQGFLETSDWGIAGEVVDATKERRGRDAALAAPCQGQRPATAFPPPGRWPGLAESALQAEGTPALALAGPGRWAVPGVQQPQGHPVKVVGCLMD